MRTPPPSQPYRSAQSPPLQGSAALCPCPSHAHCRFSSLNPLPVPVCSIPAPSFRGCEDTSPSLPVCVWTLLGETTWPSLGPGMRCCLLSVIRGSSSLSATLQCLAQHSFLAPPPPFAAVQEAGCDRRARYKSVASLPADLCGKHRNGTGPQSKSKADGEPGAGGFSTDEGASNLSGVREPVDACEGVPASSVKVRKQLRLR